MLRFTLQNALARKAATTPIRFASFKTTKAVLHRATNVNRFERFCAFRPPMSTRYFNNYNLSRRTQCFMPRLEGCHKTSKRLFVTRTKITSQAAGKTKEKKILDVKKPETFQEMASIDSMVVSGLFIAGDPATWHTGQQQKRRKTICWMF